jgi:hypothetical protein
MPILAEDNDGQTDVKFPTPRRVELAIEWRQEH